MSYEKVKTCKHCPYYTHKFVSFTGPKNAKIVFIGEAPGVEEERLGISFVGQAGKKLNSLLSRSNIEREGVRILNICCCRPPNNEKPDSEAIELCSRFWKDELTRIDPRVVVLLGDTALRAVLRKQGITKNRGIIYESKEFEGIKFIPTFHPAYLLRSPGYSPLVVKDFAFAKRIADGKEEVKMKQVYTIVSNIKKFDKLIRQLEKVKVFSCDLETSCLSWAKSQILSMAFSWKEGSAITLPIVSKNLEKLWKSKELRHISKKLKVALESDKSIKIFHNGIFDLSFLREFTGCDTDKVKFHDTMLMAHLLDENLPKSLKALTQLHTDMGDYEKEFRKALKGKNYVAVSQDIRDNYNSADADATIRIFPILWSKLRKNKSLLSMYENQLIPLTHVLLEMEKWGILVSKKRLEKLERKLTYQIKRLESNMFNSVGEFNPRSTKQLQEILFDKLKLPIQSKTEKGAPQTNKETLEVLKGRHPLINWLLKHRKASKLYSAYVEGLKDDIDENWRVHPSFRIAGTVTGRLAASDPPIQTIPQGDEIRSLFVAKKNWRIIEADYSQAELRTVAILSNDKVMIEVFKEFDRTKDKKKSIHYDTARIFFGKKPEDVTDEEYAEAKRFNFGLLYGASAGTLSELMGVDEDKIRVYMERYMTRYKGLAKYLRNMPKLARKQGYIENCFGRRRRFLKVTDPKVLADQERQAVNYLPQSIVSDVACRALIKIHQRFKKEKIKAIPIIPFHDAIIVECHKKYLKRCKRIMREEMTRPVKEFANYSFPIEIGVGKDWAKAEENAK